MERNRRFVESRACGATLSHCPFSRARAVNPLALLNPRRDLHKRDSYSSRRVGMAVSPTNMYVSEYDHTGFFGTRDIIINLEDDPFLLGVLTLFPAVPLYIPLMIPI
jgi:hypothetical protein